MVNRSENVTTKNGLCPIHVTRRPGVRKYMLPPWELDAHYLTKLLRRSISPPRASGKTKTLMLCYHGSENTTVYHSRVKNNLKNKDENRQHCYPESLFRPDNNNPVK